MLIVILQFDLNTERRGEKRGRGLRRETERGEGEGEGGGREREEYKLSQVQGLTGELQFYIFPEGGSGVSLDSMKQRQNTDKNNK